MDMPSIDDLTGYRLVPVRSTRGEPITRVETPFAFHDGHPISMLVAIEGRQTHFFDDGETLFNLSLMGFDLADRRRWRPLKSAAQRYGVSLGDDGNFETWARPEFASSGLARFCSAMLAIRDWAQENAELPADAAWLADEVALYLRAWKPKQEIRREVKARGLSGQFHQFNFQVDDELIDAIIPQTSSSAAVLRKMVDVRGAEPDGPQRFLVIIDDRRRPDLAAQEATILGNVASTWVLTRLIESVKHSGVEH